jgi:ketosteroid isomerase-like protein
MIKGIVFTILLLTQQISADEEKVHQELRGLLTGIEQAINSQQYGDLAQYFSKEMKATAINQEFLASHADIEPYFEKWFGKNGKIQNLEIKLTADEKTKFYGNNIGIVYGKGVERYVLNDTRHFDMLTRWTATVLREEDGRWRILTLHIGTDFLDNPLLNAIEKSTISFAGAGAGAGLRVGLILGALFWRRKRTH